MRHIALLHEADFADIAVSVKASGVPETIAANRLLAQQTDCPLHLGVTEAGTESSGRIKSAIGIGTLLAEGIGDTIRVSLTADPLAEVAAAKEILSALHLRREGMEIISCPTCGRTRIDLIPLVAAFERELDRTGLRSLPLKVAFMGCVVNGRAALAKGYSSVVGRFSAGCRRRRLFPHCWKKSEKSRRKNNGEQKVFRNFQPVSAG